MTFIQAKTPSQDQTSPLTPMAWLQIGIVFIMALLSLGSVQFSKYDLVGIDSFYHTSTAELIRDQGLVKSLPWVSASVYKDRYADTEVLFHAMLIPFLGNEKRLGPKVFTVLLSSLFISLLAWMMLRHAMPWTWFWICVILGAGVALNFRLNLTRPHLLSLILTFLFVHFLLARNKLGLLIVSVLFPLAYVAAHLLLIIAMIYFASCLMTRQRLPWTSLLLTLTGIAIGIAANPYRNNWPYIWWILNVGDLSNVLMHAAVPVREFIPPLFEDVILKTGLVILVFVPTATIYFVMKTMPTTKTVFLAILAATFFAMYLMFQRFIIYWVVSSVLLMASAASDADFTGILSAASKRHRHVSAIIVGLALSLLCFQLIRSVIRSQKTIAAENTPRYTHAAVWMKRHIPAGSTVFTCQWDSTPFLIYYAPSLRYINVLSPNFMIAYDQKLYDTWVETRDGIEPDALKTIVQKFHSHWLLVEKDRTHGKLLDQARSNKRSTLEYEDYEAALFRLSDLPQADYR